MASAHDKKVKNTAFSEPKVSFGRIDHCGPKMGFQTRDIWICHVGGGGGY